jgi:hypothetical protein
MDQARVVQIVGASGVGKSGVLKALASQERNEGTVLVLAPGRIIGGGWLHMAHVIGCPVARDELFNELGCGGGATLFVDNIDQIDDAGAWLTLRDLLRSVLRCAGWRAVFTVRSDSKEWRTNLPEEMRQLPFGTIRVNPLSDEGADVLRTDNPALAALLSGSHPARVMARNLFYLSCLVDWASAAGPSLANELDLARLWWRFGGARSEAGRLERLKLLRDLGERLIRAPGLATFRVDELNCETVEELLHVDSLREDRAGATVAFGHDTLRDWTIGFLLDERPELLTALPVDRPLPGALARGLEIAARLALDSDTTGARWLALLAEFERDGCRGSWRRPALLALPRSENAFDLFERVTPALVADKGRAPQGDHPADDRRRDGAPRANSCAHSNADVRNDGHADGDAIGAYLDATRGLGGASVRPDTQRPDSRSRECVPAVAPRNAHAKRGNQSADRSTSLSVADADRRGGPDHRHSRGAGSGFRAPECAKKSA